MGLHPQSRILEIVTFGRGENHGQENCFAVTAKWNMRSYLPQR